MRAARRPTIRILWVDVSADGAVSQGEVVPGWWQGEPQGC
jgi:hypothetical protein